MVRDRRVTQPAGSSVRLRCRAEAVPPASVVWIKDGQLLVTPSRQRSDEDGAAADGDHDDDGGDSGGDEAGFILRLASVTVEDTGQYTCRVFNDVGHINFTYDVHVTGLLLSVSPCKHSIALTFFLVRCAALHVA